MVGDGMTDAPLMGPVDAPDLHVMSYNIRVRIPHLNPRSPDRWAAREPLIARLLRSERPALLGVQEALLGQARSLRDALGRGYRVLGHGRRRNRGGEGCPILYDSARLALLDWSQVALSDTPDVAGSSTWGNKDPRLVVRALLRDRATGAEFVALNTHLDHRSRRSRLKSVAQLRRMVEASPLPAVVTGDFNTDVTSLPHVDLLDGGLLRDGWSAADDRVSEAWGTFPNYREPRLHRKRIDWILTSPAIDVRRFGVNVTRYDGMWPSDHTPVQAVLRIPAPVPSVE